MKMLKNILGFVVILSVVLLVGCTKELNGVGGVEAPEGEVRVRITTSSTSHQLPSTRAATLMEDSIDLPWVLVFSRPTTTVNSKFVEAKRATGKPNDGYVNLKKGTGYYAFYVIANASAFVESKLSQLVVGVTTIDDATEILSYGDSNATPIAGVGDFPETVNYMPFTNPARPIPMAKLLSGIVNVDSNTRINATGTAAGGPLQLERVTAKVVVDASKVFDNFKISGIAGFAGAPNSGWLVPSNRSDISLPHGECIYDKYMPINAQSAAENNTFNHPIYVYEHSGWSHIILKGSLRGGSEKYYKIQIKPSNVLGITLYRNNSYTMVVTALPEQGDPGYNTLAEAFADTYGRGSFYVTMLINSSTGTDIISNETCFLATDCSEIVFYSDQNETDATLLNRPLVSVTTNAPSYAFTSSVTTTGGINIDRSTLILNSNPANNSVTDIRLTSWSGTAPSGTIIIRAGSLTKVIKVIRKPPFLIHETHSLGSDIVFAEVDRTFSAGNWLYISHNTDPDNATDKVTNTTSAVGGDVYMIPDYDAPKAGGMLYYTRGSNSSSGRVKCFVRTFLPLAEFAMSNIVKREDGTLYFAENVAALTANTAGASGGSQDLTNVQGLLFKWGSLIGLQAAGSSGTAWVADRAVFTPSGYGTAINTYASVPYSNTDLGAYSTYRDEFIKAYKSVGYNTNSGKGDICRYISDRGWVTGRWRMPIAQEFKDLGNSGYQLAGLVGSSGSYQYIDPTLPDSKRGVVRMTSGFYYGPKVKSGLNVPTDKTIIPFPYSGTLYTDGRTLSVGVSAPYWTSSIKSSGNGYRGQGEVSTTIIYGVPSNEAYPVRCVRDK